MTIKTLTILLLLLGSPFLSSAQKYYQKEDLMEDMDTLYAKINESHPDMFARASRQEFENRFRQIKTAMPDSLDAVSFYRLIAPSVSSLNDGHTGIYISSNEYKNSTLYVLPVFLHIINGDLIISDSDYSASALESDFNSDKVESINGLNAKAIIDKVLDLKFGVEHFRTQWVNSDFYIFSVALNAPEYVIRHHDCDSIRTTLVKGIEYNEFRREMDRFHAGKQQVTDKKSPQTQQPPFKYKIYDPLNTAILTLRKFTDNNGTLDSFLKEMFTDIKQKKIKDLIIDIRNNGGGDSGVGDKIFQYIAHSRYNQFEKINVKISEPLKKAQPWFGKYANGTIQEFDMRPMRLHKNNLRFRGNVYLLTDNGTFSSGTSFANAFKFYKMGTIVGEKCGEPIADYGDVISGNLPNTHLGYSVSCKMFLFAGATEKDTDTYVIPDIETPSKLALDKVFKIIAAKH